MAISRSIVQHLLVILMVGSGGPASLADNLPLPPGKAETPITRALTDEEAARSAGTRLVVSGHGAAAVARALSRRFSGLVSWRRD